MKQNKATTPEETAPWWSWAPRFPQPAIAAAALLYDAVAAATILWQMEGQESLKFWPTPYDVLDAIMAPSITANALALTMFLQLNAELIHMILTRKAQHEEKREAKEQGIAIGQSQAEARFREWYETNQDKLKDLPPPPFSSNGHQS